ncbi:MAG: subclass B1 metallo-beta-lactamase [Bacteroidetes bacterium]|nr:MAG: subclass B1 metallo-beta-lactamase [Bacteroidota bacterium]
MELRELSPNVHMFTTYKELPKWGKIPANGLYLVGDSGVLLIDTPWDQKQCEGLLEIIWHRHRKQVKYAVATHFHDDRTGGLAEMKKAGVKTYSSELTRAYCKAQGEEMAEYFFRGDTTFNLGNLRVDVRFPGAGHSPDNLIAAIEPIGILYGGCFVKSLESKGIGNLSDANLKSWKKAMKWTKRKYGNYRLVVPGHYAVSGPENLDHSLNLIQEEIRKQKNEKKKLD